MIDMAKSLISRCGAWVHAIGPGVALCGVVTVAGFVIAHVEEAVFGHAWLEALVLAILLGAAVRSLWMPGPRWSRGVAFSGKTLLEIAVMLLGASLDSRAVLASGPALLGGIFGVVCLALIASYGIGRVLGLPRRMAMLIACGNSICGNSAIAAVAPVIGASGRDITASIGFTAVIGVGLVLILPALVPLLSVDQKAFGVLAGLTVYAVPQVLAATAPVGATAVHVGTLVKLTRVLMLGPVVFILSLLNRSLGAAEAVAGREAGRRPRLHRLLPWFIVGFAVLSTLRAVDLIPSALLQPAALVASALTIVSMAALGLGTDVKAVASSGGRIMMAVTASLLLLAAISFGLIRLLALW